MHDVNEPTPTPPAAAPETARPRRRWLAALVYALAGVGVLALALAAVAYYRHVEEERKPKRATIDESKVIDNVMGATYGKYSDTKQGWLYVDDDNVTYLMRVVQQAKVPGGPDGDELYFMASGAAVGGTKDVAYGVFRVRPTHPYDGTLRQSSVRAHYSSPTAVRADQVRLEAFGEHLWGWVIKTQRINDHEEGGAVTTMNTVIAPHGDQLAYLGEFIAARKETPTESCKAAKAAWDEFWRLAEEDFEQVEGVGPPLRCDNRRWTYRIGTAVGNTPAPITVTLGGTQDGQPVKSRSWKLKFDPKSSGYVIPKELQLPQSEGGEE